MKIVDKLTNIFTPYGTIGRKKYIFTLIATTLLVAVIVQIISIIIGYKNIYSDTSILEISILICSPLVYISLVTVIRRCRDAGISPWWTGLTLIPFLNIFIGLFLLFKGTNKKSSKSDEISIQENLNTNINVSSILTPGKQNDNAGSMESKIVFGLIAVSLITISVFYVNGDLLSSFDKLISQNKKYKNESLRPFAFYTSEPTTCNTTKKFLPEGITLDEIKRKSESGDVVARLNYPFYLLYGENPDFNAAHILLKNRVDSGDFAATHILAELYICGFSLEKNTEKGIAYLETLGNPAYRDLAQIYEFGRGIEIDIKKAFNYRIKAAEVSKYKMDAAEMLFNGRGVKQDKKKSFFLLKDSIENYKKDGINMMGSYENFNLGLMYYNGDGTEKNLIAAKSIFIEILAGREHVDDLRIIQVSERILAELEAQK